MRILLWLLMLLLLLTRENSARLPGRQKGRAGEDARARARGRARAWTSSSSSVSARLPRTPRGRAIEALRR